MTDRNRNVNRLPGNAVVKEGLNLADWSVHLGVRHLQVAYRRSSKCNTVRVIADGVVTSSAVSNSSDNNKTTIRYLACTEDDWNRLLPVSKHAAPTGCFTRYIK